LGGILPQLSGILPQLKGCARFKLRWRFECETAYHTEVSECLHYTIRFDRTDETRRVEISAAWINPLLEEGHGRETSWR
jgi:hypothetical protein